MYGSWSLRKSIHTCVYWWPKSGPKFRNSWPNSVRQLVASYVLVHSVQASGPTGCVGEPSARRTISIAAWKQNKQSRKYTTTKTQRNRTAEISTAEHVHTCEETS